MDVLFLNCSLYSIPSSHRVGAIVHDGAADLRLWRGPGPDKELVYAYGDGLQSALDTQRKNLERERFDEGTVIRVHRGRLHCDFLAWVVTRPPEPGTSRVPAPKETSIGAAVESVLAFVAERSVARVAFGALGDGPDAVDDADRLATVVEAAHRYLEKCISNGRAPVVEQVLVCEPRASVLSAAKRRVKQLAKSAEPARPVAAARKPTTRARPVRRATARKPATPHLEQGEVAKMRASASPYDMTRTYGAGDWLIHPKFGVGRVEGVTAEGHLQVLFESGDVRKMAHARG